MKLFTVLLLILAFANTVHAQISTVRLPEYTTHELNRNLAVDWLLDGKQYTAGVFRGSEPSDLILSNGLIERRFRITPNLACYSMRNLPEGQELIRAIQPEAMITLNGSEEEIGGLQGQFEYAYFRVAWFDSLVADEEGFKLRDYRISEISARFDWAPVRWIPGYTWPPKGKEVIFSFSSVKYPGIDLFIHYELYDGIPLMSKWLSLRNNSGKEVSVRTFTNELLALVEPASSPETIGIWDFQNMLICSDYAFMGMNAKQSNRTTYRVRDSLYTSQVDYEMNTPCLIQSRPPLGPDQVVAPGTTFTTFRVYELIFDSYDPERKGLATRKMFRTLSPWAMENPIFLHLTSTDPEVVTTAIDQCVNTGFEMIILSFGSGLNMESRDTVYIAQMKSLVNMAREKGIELGGYSLLASRRINDNEDVIHPKSGKTGGAIFGNSPCLESNWGQRYFQSLKNFIEQTGFTLLEHDGSYPGDLCASTLHPGHKGLEDSQWNQWKRITEFYRWCRENDIYLNVPDWYFLQGSNKTGIGYRETNWSLPRDRQILLGRQNLYDGTWEKTPSMGWTFVPLVEYHGGGSAATLEPLSEHLSDYTAHLVQNFGAGVQACYRGFRLYDTEATRNTVVQWVDWYKKHRLILNADIIHLRRADGRDWDGFIHVDPALEEKGMLLVFNPLDTPIQRSIHIPLYYSGLQKSAVLLDESGDSQQIFLNEHQDYILDVTIPPKGFRWFVFK